MSDLKALVGIKVTGEHSEDGGYENCVAGYDCRQITTGELYAMLRIAHNNGMAEAAENIIDRARATVANMGAVSHLLIDIRQPAIVPDEPVEWYDQIGPR